MSAINDNRSISVIKLSKISKPAELTPSLKCYRSSNSKMQLIENFNTSDEHIPRNESHDIFVVYVKSDDCGIVQDLAYSQRCSFVKATENCKDHVNIFDYISFVYCTIDARSEVIHWLVMLALLAFVCYMFTILGSTADMFLCPALTVISTMLRMSENLAGVTILAFGNAAPDVFVSLANLDGDTNLLIAEAYGSSVFIIAAITAVILIVQPFKVYGPSFVRDSIFIILICVYVNYIIYDGTVNIYEALCITGIYILYIIVVIMDQFIVMHMAKDVQRKLDMVMAGMADDQLREELQELKQQGVLEILGKKSHISLDIEETKSASFEAETANTKLFEQFISSVNPIDMEEWDESGVVGKIMMVLKAPITFILLLAIPIVDYEKQTHGWSKLLNTLQIFITPVFIVVMNEMWDLELKGVSIFVYIAGIAGVLMVIVFFVSRTDRPPVFHVVYAVAAMVASIVVIQTVASEVVTILDTVGIAAKLTPSFLGCTILAWGNSVGDLFSNVTLARQGYHKMGFAACFGGPMIIIILGLGITFTYKVVNSPVGLAEIHQGSMGSTSNMFVLLATVFALMGIMLCKFQARHSIGVALMVIYLLFLLYAVLGEFEVIHTYGTDHKEQRVVMD